MSIRVFKKSQETAYDIFNVLVIFYICLQRPILFSAHMYKFLMTYQVTLLSCLIFTVCTLKSQAHMYRFMMSSKVTFLSCLIFTLWTLEFLAHMYRFMMSSKVPFLSCLIFTLWILEIYTFFGFLSTIYVCFGPKTSSTI